MKSPFIPPPGEQFDSSESSDDESVVPLKPTKKNTRQNKSPTVEAMAPQKSKKSNSLSHVDIVKKTKYTKPLPQSSTAHLFDDSAGSDDAYVAPLKTTRDDDNPFPITMSRCNKEDKRKIEFTMVNDPQ